LVPIVSVPSVTVFKSLDDLVLEALESAVDELELVLPHPASDIIIVNNKVNVNNFFINNTSPLRYIDTLYYVTSSL
jgi:hypothetical protein